MKGDTKKLSKSYSSRGRGGGEEEVLRSIPRVKRTSL